jgi:outer membrane murein-binding lipoprotein Lpp
MSQSTTRAFVSPMLVYSLVAIAVTGSIGLGTVWTRQQISFVANDNKALVSHLADLNRRCEETTAEIAAAQDPATLQERNRDWHLGLVPPSEGQMHPVAADPETRLARKRNGNLFDDHAVGVSFRIAAQP